VTTYAATAAGENQWRNDVDAQGGQVHGTYTPNGDWMGYAVYPKADGSLDYELAPTPILQYESGLVAQDQLAALISRIENAWNDVATTIQNIPGDIASGVNKTFWDIVGPLLPTILAVGGAAYLLSRHGPRVSAGIRETFRRAS
jgi:hypothetical protein